MIHYIYNKQNTMNYINLIFSTYTINIFSKKWNLDNLQNLILLLATILLSYLIYKNLNNIILYFKSNNEITIKFHKYHTIIILKKYLKYCPDIIKNDVGETHGNLDMILDSIAENKEQENPHL